MIEERPGHVYLVKIDNKRFKIGKAKDLHNRLSGLSEFAREVYLLHAIETNDVHTLEKELHSKYWAKKLNGHKELFDLSDLDIAEIKKLSVVTYEDRKPIEVKREMTIEEHLEKLKKVAYRRHLEFMAYVTQEVETLLSRYPCLTKAEATEIAEDYVGLFYGRRRKDK